MKKLKVLIAIDEPELSKYIVREGCNFLDRENCEITLLNVSEITLAEEEYFYKEHQKFIEHEAEKAEFALIENYLEREGFNYQGFLYKEGNAANNIIKTVENEGFELVILGSHNKRRLERMFLGSVSYRVSRNCKSSVLVIKRQTKPQTVQNHNFSLLFAADSSEYCDYAAENLGYYIDKRRTLVSLLNVTVPIQQVIPTDAYIYTDIARILDESDMVARDILQNAAFKLLRQGFKINRKYFVTGDPAESIIKEAQNNNCDLIVMGSHGTSGMADWLIGSISASVYEYSPISMLIVKNIG